MTTDPPEGDGRTIEEDFREDLRLVAMDLRAELEGHPTPDELVDYHLGALSAEAEERLQEHLSLCPECSQVVLDLVEFSREPVVVPDLPAASLESAWEAIEARLEPPPPVVIPALQPQRRLSWPLAASLLTVLGLFGWNLMLRRDLQETNRPRTDIAMAELVPEAVQRRSDERPARVVLGRAQSQVLLLLTLGELREFPHYRMDLTDSSGEVVWTQAGVPRREDGTFLLAIPARMLEPGLYGIRLHGMSDGGSLSLADYSFEIVREDHFLPEM